MGIAIHEDISSKGQGPDNVNKVTGINSNLTQTISQSTKPFAFQGRQIGSCSPIPLRGSKCKAATESCSHENGWYRKGITPYDLYRLLDFIYLYTEERFIR